MNKFSQVYENHFNPIKELNRIILLRTPSTENTLHEKKSSSTLLYHIAAYFNLFSLFFQIKLSAIIVKNAETAQRRTFAYLASTWDLIDGIMAANSGIVDLIFCYFSWVEIKVIDDWQERTEDAERTKNPQCSIEKNHMNYWWLWRRCGGEKKYRSGRDKFCTKQFNRKQTTPLGDLSNSNMLLHTHFLHPSSAGSGSHRSNFLLPLHPYRIWLHS